MHMHTQASDPAFASHSMSVSASGGADGNIANFDLTSGKRISSYQAASDTVNGFQFHPFLPLSATASGGSLDSEAYKISHAHVMRLSEGVDIS